MVSPLPTRQTSLSCQSASHSSLRPLFPPRDAWNSLGKMSREEAMSAYISEMKLVAQKVGRGCRFLSIPKVPAGGLSSALPGLTPILCPAH